VNRRTVLCGALAVAMLLALGSAAVARTWTDASGQYHVDGDFVSVESGVVTLKTADGKRVQIPFEKLSKGDQEFIGKSNEPGPTPNPFVEVPKAAGDAATADPVKKTQEYVADLLKRLSDQIDGIAALDTQEKKNAALDKIEKSLLSELKQKSMTFRFTVQDIVAENDSRSYRLVLVEPVGTEGFDSVIGEIDLPIRKADATKINRGDMLVLSGKGIVEIDDRGRGNVQGYVGRLRGEFPDRFTHAVIGTYWSDVSKHQYVICLSNLKFKTEHKK